MSKNRKQYLHSLNLPIDSTTELNDQNSPFSRRTEHRRWTFNETSEDCFQAIHISLFSKLKTNLKKIREKKKRIGLVCVAHWHYRAPALCNRYVPKRSNEKKNGKMKEKERSKNEMLRRRAKAYVCIRRKTWLTDSLVPFIRPTNSQVAEPLFHRARWYLYSLSLTDTDSPPLVVVLFFSLSSSTAFFAELKTDSTASFVFSSSIVAIDTTPLLFCTSLQMRRLKQKYY